MAAVDYTTVIIHKGDRAEEMKIGGITISGYKYEIYFNDIPVEGCGFKNIKVEDPDLHNDIFITNISGYFIFVSKNSSAMGGASYLYAFNEDLSDIWVLVTGYGHYRNPLLHFLGRGLSEYIEDKLIDNFWCECFSSINVHELLDGCIPSSLKDMSIKYFEYCCSRVHPRVQKGGIPIEDFFDDLYIDSLREELECSRMDCEQALIDSNWDYGKAKDTLTEESNN